MYGNKVRLGKQTVDKTRYCISEDTSFPSTPAVPGDFWRGFVAVPLHSAAALWLSLAGCQDHLQMLDEISGGQIPQTLFSGKRENLRVK